MRKEHVSKRGNDYLIMGYEGTGYIFMDSDGNSSGLSFDTVDEVKDYIEQRENGNAHFTDKLD